jgi:hypothetical protein
MTAEHLLDGVGQCMAASIHQLNGDTDTTWTAKADAPHAMGDRRRVESRSTFRTKGVETSTTTEERVAPSVTQLLAIVMAGHAGHA